MNRIYTAGRSADTDIQIRNVQDMAGDLYCKIGHAKLMFAASLRICFDGERRGGKRTPLLPHFNNA